MSAPLSATGSWSNRLADVSGAARLAGSGRGVTVAVLDTWVEGSHPDFGERVEVGVTCVDGRCSSYGTQPDTCPAHGTHVAGLIASTRYGVAPLATVLPIRVLTSAAGSCTATAADVALGIRYAIHHHVRLINVSLGSSYPLEDPGRVLPAAVTAAAQAGDLVIVAAGNGAAKAEATYGSNALTVAALGPDGRLASYSQRGSGVDIAAPGGQPAAGTCAPDRCILSTWSAHGYAYDAGTSMAAPFVSGTAALLLSQDPQRSVAKVRELILATARPLPGAGAGGLDVLAAVRAGQAKPSPSSAPSLVWVLGTVLLAAVVLTLAGWRWTLHVRHGRRQQAG